MHLTRALAKEVGNDNIICTDVSDQKYDFPCRYEKLDICDANRYRKLVETNKVDHIVHLAGILSALGEKNPQLAIDVNVFGVVNALRIAQDNNCRIFIPSSIAVFGGDHFNKKQTPAESILQPRTVYGVSKVFNEMIGEYFSNKFDMDFRSIRYPVIISSEKFGFNGTAAYSTEIFFEILEKGHYNVPLKEDAALPMMYIDDCIDATMKFLKADFNKLKRKTYNLAGISVAPKEYTVAVQKLLPGSTVDFKPDFRQAIAESWPQSINDSESLRDWNWSYEISVSELAKKVYDGIDPRYKSGK